MKMVFISGLGGNMTLTEQSNQSLIILRGCNEQ